MSDTQVALFRVITMVFPPVTIALLSGGALMAVPERVALIFFYIQLIAILFILAN